MAGDGWERVNNKTMKKETYSVKWKCGNCGSGYPSKDDLEIPKGTKIEDFCKKTECPVCGNRGVMYKYEKTNEILD